MKYSIHYNQNDLLCIKAKDSSLTPAYYYMKINKIKQITLLKEIENNTTINLFNYGEIIFSGYGIEPPKEIHDRIIKQREYK